MKRSEKVIYQGDGFDITLREVIFSIVIVLVMLTIGFFISEKIQSANDEANQQYYQAVKIDGDSELFQYGMRTNVGNAFVSGDLVAVDTVTFPDIDGEYSFVKKVREEYTKHERVVTKTRTNSKGEEEEYEEIEEYWTWDEVSSETKHSEKISFLGTEFDYGKISLPGARKLTTKDGGYHVRYVYYVKNTSYSGTIYTDLRNNTISDNTSFMRDLGASEAVDYKVKSGTMGVVAFWIFWIILIGAALYGFYYLDNNWLEDN